MSASYIRCLINFSFSFHIQFINQIFNNYVINGTRSNFIKQTSVLVFNAVIGSFVRYLYVTWSKSGLAGSGLVFYPVMRSTLHFLYISSREI